MQSAVYLKISNLSNNPREGRIGHTEHTQDVYFKLQRLTQSLVAFIRGQFSCSKLSTNLVRGDMPTQRTMRIRALFFDPAISVKTTELK